MQLSYTRTNNYIRAERLNKFESVRYQNRLNYINWQQDMRAKLYDDKIQKLRGALEMVPRSTGRSRFAEFCSTAAKPLDYPTLQLGSKRLHNSLTFAPAAVDQQPLRFLRTPNLCNDTGHHLGWDLRQWDVGGSPRTPAGGGALQPDAEIFPPAKMGHWMDRAAAERLGKSLRNVRLAPIDERFVRHLGQTERKVAKFAQRESCLEERLADAMATTNNKQPSRRWRFAQEALMRKIKEVEERNRTNRTEEKEGTAELPVLPEIGESAAMSPRGSPEKAKMHSRKTSEQTQLVIEITPSVMRDIIDSE